MTQQQNLNEPTDESRLLSELRGTNPEALANGVSKVEGETGSILQPVYTRRKIVCYSVTEQELQANFNQSVYSSLWFSAAAFFFGIWFDFIKDNIGQPVNESIDNLTIYYIKTGSLTLAAITFTVGAIILYFNHKSLRSIKSEQVM